jgi:predicted AlkP superfamily phosphohydrolase/phosphomutase
MGKRRLLVMGLDSAPPELLFDKFRNELPNIRGLMEHGVYARMRSSDPPITIPAWMVMATSRNPGSLGLYGFRHRKGFSYADGWIANSLSVNAQKIWDILGEAGMRVCVVGVPPSYPPTPVNGELISCFITPDANREYTYPPELKQEIEDLVGPYPFDVEFRTDQRDQLLKDLHLMTETHFRVIEHLMTTRQWDFFMFVDIGLDRMHHAFWKYFDKEHPKYVLGNKYESAMVDYYKRLDEYVGRLLKRIDDDTIVMAVSDHGVKRMRGAFCVNEWLIREGYLVLKERPLSVVELEKAAVDWGRTKAWAWGGYYARVFLNVKGRELQGVIEPSEFERERDKLAEMLKDITDPGGRRMETHVYKPETLYRVSVGDRPDLMVYFDDLFWRSAGTLGHSDIYLSENDTGPDDAVHSQYGTFILLDKQVKQTGRIEDIDILDIAPTLLERMRLPIPATMEGKPIF